MKLERLEKLRTLIEKYTDPNANVIEVQIFMHDVPDILREMFNEIVKLRNLAESNAKAMDLGTEAGAEGWQRVADAIRAKINE